MTKRIILAFIMLSGMLSFSQIDFEKGYIINNSGKRTDCYIKNYDWKNNPVTIEYKLTPDSSVSEGSLKDVSEFGIDNFSKYVRAYVDVDRASLDLNNYGWSRTPEFKQESLFLKVLKEGSVVLYKYEDASLNLYFIRAKENKIEQLIFKPYKVSDLKTEFYTYFRQQLLNAFDDCKDIVGDIEKTKYNKSDLEKLFAKYYQCSGQSVEEINKNKPKSKFNLTVRPGLSVNSLSYKRNGYPAADVDFGSKVSARIGVELEVVLPFNKSKWALIAEPYYSSYSFSKEIPTYGTVNADCKFINMALGVRHYMFLNKESKLFLNLAYAINISNDSTGGYEFGQDGIEIDQGEGILAGMGFKYKKYSAEARVDFGKSGATNYVDLAAKSSSFSFILGYTFF